MTANNGGDVALPPQALISCMLKTARVVLSRTGMAKNNEFVFAEMCAQHLYHFVKHLYHFVNYSWQFHQYINI